jgi:hypothetical protein
MRFIKQNDCEYQHAKFIEQVLNTNPKVVTDASGFGPRSRNADIQILPLEAPEIIAVIVAIVFVAMAL